MYKYLYGKRKYLSGLIEGRHGVRLSDIACYSNLDNEKMRDDELAKKFVYDKDKVSVFVNGSLLSPEHMPGNPVVTLYPSRCFCVCFSDSANDPVLFERFKADVCVEIDIEKMVAVLTAGLSILEGVEVLHDSVNYYPEVMSSPAPDLASSVFYKPDVYSVEQEYRVVVTIPPSRKHFLGDGKEKVQIFSDDPNDMRHMFVNADDPKDILSYISSVYYLND